VFEPYSIQRIKLLEYDLKWFGSVILFKRSANFISVFFSCNLHMLNAKCSAEEDGCVICMTSDEVVYNGTYQSSSLHD